MTNHNVEIPGVPMSSCGPLRAGKSVGRHLLRRSSTVLIGGGLGPVHDVFRMITGIIGVDYGSDEQRERVLRMAIDGIRAR